MTGMSASPASVSRYSSRGGRSEYWRRTTSPASTRAASRAVRDVVHDTAELPVKPERGAALALAAGVFMANLDLFTVNLALPSVAATSFTAGLVLWATTWAAVALCVSVPARQLP